MKNKAVAYYCIEDIAQMLDVTDRTVRNYLKTGILNGVKVGGQWRFTEAQVNQLLAGEKVATKKLNLVAKENSETYGSYSCDSLDKASPPGLLVHAVIEKRLSGFDLLEVNRWQENILSVYKKSIELCATGGTMEFVYDDVVGMARWRLSGSLNFMNMMMKGFETYE